MRRGTIGIIANLVLGLFAVPLALAQSRGNIPLVGMLIPGTSAVASNTCIANFQQGLRDLGYVEGQSIRLEVRYAQYQKKWYAVLAAELVQLAPDVLVTNTTPALLAVKQATATIPIVMAPAAIWSSWVLRPAWRDLAVISPGRFCRTVSCEANAWSCSRKRRRRLPTWPS